MKNTISILSAVVIFASATILMSSCTKEHVSGDNFQNISTVENAQVNTVYSVEGVSEIKIALSMNEEFDAVDILLGYNSFCNKNGDGGWFIVQHDTVTIKIDPNWTVCKIIPRYGTPQVKISAK